MKAFIPAHRTSALGHQQLGLVPTQGCWSGGCLVPRPCMPLRGHSDVLDPQPSKAQCHCRTLKAQRLPRTEWVTVSRRVRQGCGPEQEGRRPHLGWRFPGAALRQHELGLKILCLFHLSAGARKRTYSLYEQLKSKINETERVTKNSMASEAAGSLRPWPAVPSKRLGGRLCMFTRSRLIRPAVR